MDASVIGLLGVIIGAVLTSIFQLVNKFIDYRISFKNRWLDDKKQTYADFLLNSNTWFRYSLVASGESVSRQMKSQYEPIITESRAQLNSHLAMINIIGSSQAVAEAENFNDWMTATTKSAAGQKRTTEKHNKYIDDFLEMRAKLTKILRDDL